MMIKFLDNPKYKLTEEQVKEINQLLKQSERQWKIAERFKITQSIVSRIATGKAWKHI
jgi:predicted XRE-type DNA-binding protein